MTIPDSTTQQTLHKILRCVQSGCLERIQTTTGEWSLYLNDQIVDDGQILLGASILEARRYITWWPKYHQPQKACLTIDPGCEVIKQWDEQDLLGPRPVLRLEMVNDVYDGGDGDTAA